MKIKIFLSCIVCSIVTHVAITARAQAVNVTDSLALVDLYNSTNGPQWMNHTNWLTNRVSTWYGVTVTGTRVTQISLSDNKMTGSIPVSIGNLAMLDYLDLSLNQLSGTIPNSIGNLVHLTYIDFYDLPLTGSIPASIGNLVNLQYLYIHDNQLSGTIPSSIGNLLNLKSLVLANNQFTGSIPSSIGNLVHLETLFLYNNQLSDTIPSTLGNLVLVESLDLSSNQLTGSIPSTFGNLTTVQYITLRHNQLTGTIPSSIAYLKNTYELGFEDNQLSGGIPAIFFTVRRTNGLAIFASHNQLSESNNKFGGEIKYNLSVFVDYNRSTFNGLEYLAAKAPYVLYTPQARLSIHQNGNKFSVYAGGTLSNNTYQWFRVGGVSHTTIIGDSVFHPKGAGKFWAKITNSVATKLTLITDTISYTPALTINETANTLSLYPNPVKDILTINGLDIKSTSNITIADVSGNVWLNGTVKQRSTARYNVSKLKPGYYVLNVNNGQEMKTLNFMKE